MPLNRWTRKDTDYLISERLKEPKTDLHFLAERLGRTKAALKARLKFLATKYRVDNLNDLSECHSHEHLLYKTGG